MPALRWFGGRKVLGGVLVAALHAVLIAMLLQLTNQHISRAVPVREIVLHFFSPPKTVMPEKPKRAETAHRKEKVPDALSPVAGPNYGGDIPALRSFGRPLLNCAPENLGNLDGEERARCANSALAFKRDDSTVDFKDHTDRSTSAALWERRRARKNAPVLLPCANPRDPTPSLATLLCLAKGALDGKFDLDAPGYQDKIEDLHLPNGGDAPDKPGGAGR